MKDEDLKRVLADALLEEAPTGFTQSLMDKIKEEEAKSKVITTYNLPAKGLLISLSIVFIVSVLWAIFAGSSSQLELDLLSRSIHFELPKLKFNELIYSNVVMYASLGFMAFLYIDYAIFRKRKVNIAG